MKTKPKQHKPFVPTPAEREQLFQHALDHAVDQAQEGYDDARKRFLKEAATSPISAIERHGEWAVEAQQRLVSLVFVRDAVKNGVGPGKQFRHRSTALQLVATTFRKTLADGATRSCWSSGLFDEGTRTASFRGVKTALDIVEYLLEHHCDAEAFGK